MIVIGLGRIYIVTVMYVQCTMYSSVGALCLLVRASVMTSATLKLTSQYEARLDWCVFLFRDTNT